MYGKEASNRKQEIDRQHYKDSHPAAIPYSQRQGSNQTVKKVRKHRITFSLFCSSSARGILTIKTAI
jgi:hypothetical protein